MREEFKVFMQPSWSIDDDGLTRGTHYFVWAQVNYISVFHTPKSSLSIGVFVARLRGKRKILAYSFADRARAKKAFDFIQRKMLESELDS